MSKKNKSFPENSQPATIPRPGSKVWRGETWGIAQSPVASSGIPQVWVAWWSEEKDNFKIPVPEMASSLQADKDFSAMAYDIVLRPEKIDFSLQKNPCVNDSPLEENTCYSGKGESPAATPSGTQACIHDQESSLSPKGESRAKPDDSPLDERTPDDSPLDVSPGNGCVVEKSPAGTARGNAKYFWYKYYDEDGKQREVYIRGGNTANPIAIMRADLIRLGIKKGKSIAELLETISNFGKKSSW